MAFLLIATQIALSAAVHHHSASLFENLEQEEASFRQEIHEVFCRTPLSTHWHRDRTIEIEPCLACLRQHLVGVQVHAPVRPIVATAETVHATRNAPPIAGFGLGPCSRGPPSLL